jgi:hypothetical protein
MIRTREPEEPSLLITRWQHWHEYALTAPQVRLERLAMALADDGRVLLLGTPLPPLPGEQWVVRAGVAAPAGWIWSPAVDPAVIRELLELPPHDLALLHTGGNWELVAAGNLVRVTRSAARNTAEALHAG